MLLLLLLQLIVQSGKRSPAVGQCLLQPGNSISFGRVQLQLSEFFKLVVGQRPQLLGMLLQAPWNLIEHGVVGAGIAVSAELCHPVVKIPCQRVRAVLGGAIPPLPEIDEERVLLVGFTLLLAVVQRETGLLLRVFCHPVRLLRRLQLLLVFGIRLQPVLRLRLALVQLHFGLVDLLRLLFTRLLQRLLTLFRFAYLACEL